MTQADGDTDAADPSPEATEHKEPVLDEAPSVHRRTFALRELAHAIDDIGERQDWPSLLDAADAGDVVSRWRALPTLVAANRGRGRDSRRDRDVSDPTSAATGRST